MNWGGCPRFHALSDHEIGRQINEEECGRNLFVLKQQFSLHVYVWKQPEQILCETAPGNSQSHVQKLGHSESRNLCILVTQTQSSSIQLVDTKYTDWAKVTLCNAKHTPCTLSSTKQIRLFKLMSSGMWQCVLLWQDTSTWIFTAVRNLNLEQVHNYTSVFCRTYWIRK
jgi:hypothetical protein